MGFFEREFRAEQFVNAPLEKVFSFFSLAENLEKLTPDFLEFKILTPLPISMRQGTLIDYRLRIHGIPLRWRTKILEWKPPLQFVDVQLKGPYSLWHHTHLFEALPDDRTKMTDLVRYQAPFGPLGLLMLPLFVRPEIEKIFAYRRQVIQQLFP